MDNIFKQPMFGTFDISGRIYYNKAYSSSEVKNNVENAIKEEYSFVTNGIVKRDFGEYVIRSKIEKIIHAVAGVEYITLTYFGRDMTDATTAVENEITAEFDEIITVSDNVVSGAVQTHGVKFDYLIAGG